jgi:DNA-binding response OmpR family regulator
MHVLLIEDNAELARLTQDGLEAAGFAVDHHADGDDGFLAALVGNYDAIVLDVMLPGRNGLDILRELRKQGRDLPVLMLTARGELNQRVEGLTLGADDYMTKPFYVEELIARVQALIRRSTAQPVTVLSIADLHLDVVNRSAQRAGMEIALSDREFALLRYLMQAPGRVFTRSQISSQVWQMPFDPSTNMVDVALARLRKKIDGDAEIKLIETVRGVGYRMVQARSGGWLCFRPPSLAWCCSAPAASPGTC